MTDGPILSSQIEQAKATNWLTKDFAENMNSYQGKPEPIAEYFKKLYLPGKTVPNLIREYDAVGFELENSLVKWNKT
jgi:hypothetical protein